MMKILLFSLAACALLPPAAVAADAEVLAVKAKSLANTLCVTCHGSNGVSVIENYPNLAAQKVPYLEKQMKDFRDGNRKDPVMFNMVASLDDEMIQALAKHYAAQSRP